MHMHQSWRYAHANVHGHVHAHPAMTENDRMVRTTVQRSTADRSILLSILDWLYLKTLK